MNIKRTENDWVCASCEFAVMPSEYGEGSPPFIRRCELCAVAMCGHHLFKVPEKPYSMCTGCKSFEHGMYEDSLSRKFSVPEYYWDGASRKLKAAAEEVEDV